MAVPSLITLGLPMATSVSLAAVTVGVTVIARRLRLSGSRSLAAAGVGACLAVIYLGAILIVETWVTGGLYHVGWYLGLICQDTWSMAVIITGVGLGVLVWGKNVGFWRRERLAVRRCPECRYDMSGLTDAETCPECGLEVVDEWTFRPYRPRPWAVRMGWGLVTVGVLTFVWMPVVQDGWLSVVPTRLLLWRAINSDRVPEAFAEEIEKRLRKDGARYLYRERLWEGREGLLADLWKQVVALDSRGKTDQNAAEQARFLMSLVPERFSARPAIENALAGVNAPRNITETYLLSRLEGWPDSLKTLAEACRADPYVVTRARAWSESFAHGWVNAADFKLWIETEQEPQAMFQANDAFARFATPEMLDVIRKTPPKAETTAFGPAVIRHRLATPSDLVDNLRMMWSRTYPRYGADRAVPGILLFQAELPGDTDLRPRLLRLITAAAKSENAADRWVVAYTVNGESPPIMGAHEDSSPWPELLPVLLEWRSRETDDHTLRFLDAAIRYQQRPRRK